MGRWLVPRWIRRRWTPCYTVILMAAILNTIVYYWMSRTHPLYDWSLQSEPNKQQRVASLRDPQERSYRPGLTIVIREYEDFANKLVETSEKLHVIVPDAVLLIVCDNVPYPALKLQSYVQVLVLNSEPFWAANVTHLENYIQTRHVLIWPDGVGFTIESAVGIIADKMSFLDQHDHTHAVVWSANNSPSLSCLLLNVNVRHWTLEYRHSLTGTCKAVHVDKNDNVVVLLRSRDLLSLPYPLWRPIREALFIQMALRGWTIDVQKHSPFTQTLLLDEHQQWKHQIKEDQRLKTLYKTFSIKLVRRLYDPIADAWYGCSRSTPRCFGTIIDDTPEYLPSGRWTPPCCLKNLAAVTLYVIETLESQGVRYWLEGGSLLGAARTGQIIPWDYDVDIGVYKEDMLKCTQLIKASSEPYQDLEGYVWERSQEEEGNFYRVQFSMSNHLHVDIFPFFANEKGMMTKNFWSPHRQDMEFPEHYLKPLEKLQFLGRMVSVPNHYKDFLELKFGVGVIEHPKYPNSSAIT